MEARKRPAAAIGAAFAHAAAAACAIAFGVDTIRQVSGFELRVGAIDPTGPETDEWINQSTASIWLIGIGGFVIATALLIVAVLAVLRVFSTGARARWISLLSVTVVAAIAPIFTLLKGGVPFYLDTIPPHYDGTPIVLRLPPAYQHVVILLDAAMLVLLALAALLLLLPGTRRYFRGERFGYTVDPYADFVRRRSDESPGREDHAR